MPDYLRIAEEFRCFAQLCREYALRAPSPELKRKYDGWAARWEKDPKQVLTDGQVIATSRALLERLGEYDAGSPVP